jgi:hypothetical protein
MGHQVDVFVGGGPLRKVLPSHMEADVEDGGDAWWLN